MNEPPEIVKLLIGATNAFAAGDHNAALHFLHQAHAIDPEHPDVWAGLGAVAWSQGDTEKAVQFTGTAALKARHEWKYWEELIRMHMASKNYAHAAQVCAECFETIKDNAQLMNFWGISLENIGQSETALEVFHHGAEIDPDMSFIHRNISFSLLRTGKPEESIAAYSRSTVPLKDGETEDAAKLDGHFAALADGYDDNALHHDMVERMAGFMMEILGDEGFNDIDVLDCCCGTGLFARRVADRLRSATGIDLSADMVAVAEKSGAYATLLVGDVVTEMTAMGRHFDAIVCNNAIPYLLDLAPFFEAAADRLVPGGRLFLGADPCSDEFDIRATGGGEYAHSRKYLTGQAARVGLITEDIRILAHRAYPGFWCAFSKPANGTAT